MSIEIKVPELPESVADATVGTWHKKPGDAVTQGENVVDLETDKIVLEVPAPESGTLGDIIKPEGEVVEADTVLANLEEGQPSQDKHDSSKAEQDSSNQDQSSSDKQQSQSQDSNQDLTPAVRRLVNEHNLDPQNITGTGKKGKITKADVEAYLEQQKTDQQKSGSMKAVKDLRARYKDSFEQKHEARLGFMSFFTKATVEALKRFPDVNASIDGNDIVYHGYYDIGMAVSTDRGLVVPVIRDADQMSFADIEKQVADFGKRGRDGKLTMDELTGGTFTITNGGVFGSLLSTPIINPPQSAILGLHKIEDRAVVRDGEIVIRPMMYLAISYDHRIIDGKQSVQFLKTIKELIEDPARLMLEV